MILFRVGIQAFAQTGPGEDRFRFVALEDGIQLLFDFCPHQQGMAGVVGTQVDATAFGGAQGEKTLGHIK